MPKLRQSLMFVVAAALTVSVVAAPVSAQDQQPSIAWVDVEYPEDPVEPGSNWTGEATVAFQYPQAAVTTEPIQVEVSPRSDVDWLDVSVDPATHEVPPPHETNRDSWTVNVTVEVHEDAPAFIQEDFALEAESESSGNVASAGSNTLLRAMADLAGTVEVDGPVRHLETDGDRARYALPVVSHANGATVVTVDEAHTAAVDIETDVPAELPSSRDRDRSEGSVAFFGPADADGPVDVVLDHHHKIRTDSGDQRTVTVALAGPGASLPGVPPIVLVGLVALAVGYGIARLHRRPDEAPREVVVTSRDP